MSLPNLKLICTGCDDYSYWLTHQIKILVYQTPEGEQYQTTAERGWCYECDALRPIEPKLDSKLIADRVKILTQSVSGILFMLLSTLSILLRKTPYKSTEMDELKCLSSALAILKLRTTKYQRCIHCGSGETTPFHQGLQHKCGGELIWKKTSPDAPLFSYKPSTTYLDFDGRQATLLSPISWASHLAKHSTIEGVMAAGKFSGMLIHIPMNQSDLLEFDKIPEWIAKFCKLIELRIAHDDFDQLVSWKQIESNSITKASIKECIRAALSADKKPVAKWHKSDVWSNA